MDTRSTGKAVKVISSDSLGDRFPLVGGGGIYIALLQDSLGGIGNPVQKCDIHCCDYCGKSDLGVNLSYPETLFRP